MVANLIVMKSFQLLIVAKGGRVRTYRNIVKVRQHEENTDNRDQRQEDAAHRRLPTSRSIDLTPSITSKGRQTHKKPTKDIRDAQCNQLSVRTQIDVLEYRATTLRLTGS